LAALESEPPSEARRAGRRAWLPLVWLLGTATAVLVGWSAVQAVVGQVVQEQPGPLSARALNGPGASPSPSPTPEQPLETPTSSPVSPPASSPPVVGRTPATGGSAPAPSKTSRTFSLVGGTVDVSCQNNQISLDWATPNAGFQVEIEWHDSNTVLEVRFTSSSHESRLETWCSAGQIQDTVEEQSS
jgi:hypothetical protein